MNRVIRVGSIAVSLLLALCFESFSQPLPITYQGRLDQGSNAVSGIYDFRFGVFDQSVNGVVLGARITNNTVLVQNGLFTTLMNLDTNLFNANDRWLEIAVRSNGPGSFVVLSPRQKFTASAYAAYAYNAGRFSGVLNGSQIAPGTVSNTHISAGAIGLAQLASGTTAAILSNAPSLTTTNAGIDPYRGIIISNGIVRLPAYNTYTNGGHEIVVGEEPGLHFYRREGNNQSVASIIAWDDHAIDPYTPELIIRSLGTMAFVQGIDGRPGANIHLGRNGYGSGMANMAYAGWGAQDGIVSQPGWSHSQLFGWRAVTANGAYAQPSIMGFNLSSNYAVGGWSWGGLKFYTVPPEWLGGSYASQPGIAVMEMGTNHLTVFGNLTNSGVLFAPTIFATNTIRARTTLSVGESANNTGQIWGIDNSAGIFHSLRLGGDINTSLRTSGTQKIGGIVLAPRIAGNPNITMMLGNTGDALSPVVSIGGGTGANAPSSQVSIYAGNNPTVNSAGNEVVRMTSDRMDVLQNLYVSGNAGLTTTVDVLVVGGKTNRLTYTKGILTGKTEL